MKIQPYEGSKVFQYEIDGHKVVIAPEHIYRGVFVDGVLASTEKDAEVKLETKLKMFPSRFDCTVTTKDGFSFNFTDKDFSFRENMGYRPGQKMGETEYASNGGGNHLNVFKDGQEIFPEPTNSISRSTENIKTLIGSYSQLGDLSETQFLALKKALGHDVQQISRESYVYLNVGGKSQSEVENHLRRPRCTPEQAGLQLINIGDIRAGDSIAIEMRSEFTFKVKTGLIDTKNVNVELYPKTFKLPDVSIEGTQSTFTTLPIDREAAKLTRLEAKGKIDLDSLNELIPVGATFSEYAIAQELCQRDITITDQLLEELSHGASVDEAIRQTYEHFVEMEKDDLQITHDEMENDTIDNGDMENEIGMSL